jgi:transposase
MQVTTIGLDLAKHVFQIHGIDAAEKVVVRRQLRRSQVMAFFEALAPCLIGIEACATAHYWARELTKLGHEVRLMPAKDVKAYERMMPLTPRRSARRSGAPPCVLYGSNRPSSRVG